MAMKGVSDTMAFRARDPARFELVCVGLRRVRPARVTLTDGTVIITQVHDKSEGWLTLSRFNGIGETYPSERVERIEILDVFEGHPEKKINTSSFPDWFASFIPGAIETQRARYCISDPDALEKAKQDYHGPNGPGTEMEADR